MSKLQPVRGTADLLPDAMARHRVVIDTACRTTARYGFQEMATPIFEFSEVFSRPLGESSDIVTKENYSFADRGGGMLALRPENTAGVVRAMISGGLTQSLPLKYFYAGPMFRYERPQKGRMRQFHQIGIEYLGPTDALADAEVISAGARLLAEMPVMNLVKVHMSRENPDHAAPGNRFAEKLRAVRIEAGPGQGSVVHTGGMVGNHHFRQCGFPREGRIEKSNLVGTTSSGYLSRHKGVERDATEIAKDLFM